MSESDSSQSQPSSPDGRTSFSAGMKMDMKNGKRDADKKSNWFSGKCTTPQIVRRRLTLSVHILTAMGIEARRGGQCVKEVAY